jgi:hypothetical protein
MKAYFTKVLAGFGMLVMVAGCSAAPSVQGTYDPVTGAYYASVLGHMDDAGGVRGTRMDTWLPTGYDPYSRRYTYGLVTTHTGYGPGTGQTVAGAVAGAAVSGAFGVASAGVSAALTRPSNFNQVISQGGATAISGSRSGSFAQGGAGGAGGSVGPITNTNTTTVTQDLYNSNLNTNNNSNANSNLLCTSCY